MAARGADASKRLRRLRAATTTLRRRTQTLRFGAPVTHVYNPLAYAARSHDDYLARFAAGGGKRVVFLGMNPGPFGMAQTGVPFGEVRAVRDWMGIEAPVGHPAREHPKRPISGFACERSEVSGQRLWGAVASHFGTPARFFARHFVANYCPLVFMESSGRNRTPDKLPAHERGPLYEACDAYLARLVAILEPRWLIGVGAFAAGRAEDALRKSAPGLRIGSILHPSPANPRANRDWQGEVRTQLAELGLCASARR